MNSLNYYKTLYIGTKDTAEVINTDDIILLDDHIIWSYCDLTAVLSDEFWKTGFQYLQGVRSGPRKVKLLITNLQATGLKCNPDNKTTSLEAIEWFLDNMESPPGGMIISIYFYENLYGGISNPCFNQTIWPMKRQWLGDGDYVTIQLPSPNASVNARTVVHYKIIDNIEKYCPYPVKYISYKDGEEFQLNTLIHSKRHFSYIGGAYYLAAMINVPTVCYQDPLGAAKGPFYELKTTNWPDKNNKKYIKANHSQFNSPGENGGMPHTRTYHFDVDNQLCIQNPKLI
jgi:hypothetical protein